MKGAAEIHHARDDVFRISRNEETQIRQVDLTF
jgi:hypothetical protein